MKIVKKMTAFILLETIVSILTLTLFLILDSYRIPTFIIFSFQMLLIVYFFSAIHKPIIRFLQLLHQCMENGSATHELLQHAPKNTAFNVEVSDVVNNYTEHAIRHNYRTIHDKQAELAALQSQINPHFLYNTLDCIRGQALLENNHSIALMVEALGNLFRYSISRKGELVTLREELANVQNYMMIQRYRFDNRFTLQIDIKPEDEVSYECSIPKLIIQPIIENAIYHGLKEKLEGGIVRIEVILFNHNLVLLISDNGEGMDPQVLSELNKNIRSSSKFFDRYEHTSNGNNGIALANIHKRLQLLFGEKYGLQVFSTLNQGTDVEIMLPARFEREIGL